LVRPGVEHLDDVLAVDGARRSRLAAEAVHAVALAPEQAAIDDLDGDALGRAVLLRLVHGAHPTLAQQQNELVLLVERFADQGGFISSQARSSLDEHRPARQRAPRPVSLSGDSLGEPELTENRMPSPSPAARLPR
jgi:hypothetical protein